MKSYSRRENRGHNSDNAYLPHAESISDQTMVYSPSKVVQRKGWAEAVQNSSDKSLSPPTSIFRPTHIPPIQAKSTSNFHPDLPESLNERIQSHTGLAPGQFKIHKNSEAANQVGAQAYSQGRDIHFAPGKFNPYSSEGRHLIAHEMAHGTQKEGLNATQQVNGVPVNDAPELEQEADQIADRVVQAKGGEEARPMNNSEEKEINTSEVVQRKPDDTLLGTLARSLGPDKIPIHYGNISDYLTHGIDPKYQDYSNAPLFTDPDGTGPLTLKDGINYDDVEQGRVGDCHVLAALAAIAKTQPGLIKNAVSPKPDAMGFYTVTLYRSKQVLGSRFFEKEKIKVRPNFPVDKASGNLLYAKHSNANEIWVMLIEKAIAKQRGGSYDDINGGNSKFTLEALTGESQERNVFEDGVIFKGPDKEDVRNEISNALQKGYPVTASTGVFNVSQVIKVKTNPKLNGNIISSHEYAVVKATASEITLYNPHGKKIKLSWEDFRFLFEDFSTQSKVD